MHNRYAQVLRSYWRHAVSSWIGMAFLVPALIMILVSLVAPGIIYRGLPSLIMVIISIPVYCLWIHLDEQIEDARRKLLPGFIVPHVAVFLALALLLAIGWPAALMRISGVRSMGFMAFAAATVAVVGLVFVGFRPLKWLAMLGSLWVILVSPSQLLWDFFNGQHEWAALPILGCALTAVVGVVFRMSRMSEEDPAYGTGPRLSTWSLRPRMTGESNRAWMQARQSWDLSNQFSSRRVINSGPGIWAGARRWLKLGSPGLGALLFFAVWMMSILWFGVGNHEGRSDKDFGLMFLIFMPAQFAGSRWIQMWRYVDAELLKPVSRHHLFKQIGAAIALDIFRMWVIMAAVHLGYTLCLRRDVNMAAQVAALVMSLGFQVLAFGVIAWCMRRRSLYSILLYFLPVMFVGIIPVTIVSRIESDFARSVATVAFLCVFVGLGISITRSAYQHWLETELG